MSQETEFKAKIEYKTASELSELLADYRAARDWMERRQEKATHWADCADWRERVKKINRKIDWIVDLLGKAYVAEKGA